MTSKDKAQELYGKFAPLVKDYDEDNFPSISLQFTNSKKCALIAVDEILRVIIFTSTPKSHLHEEQTYWSQVKEEIKKL